MAYVQVPKDLTKVKTKVIFNMTKRQLICFSLAVVLGVPLYLATKNIIGNTLASTLMIIVMMPCFLFALYEKDGRPLEKILMNMIKVKYLRPAIRKYQTNNMYKILGKEIKREVRNVKRKKE